MWGSFGINIHVPKVKVSKLTMDVIIPNDPEMEVSPKLLCYWDLTLLAWHVGIIWDQYLCATWVGMMQNCITLVKHENSNWNIYISLANEYWSQMIPTCQARSVKSQKQRSFGLAFISGSFVSMASMVGSLIKNAKHYICAQWSIHVPVWIFMFY